LGAGGVPGVVGRRGRVAVEDGAQGGADGHGAVLAGFGLPEVDVDLPTNGQKKRDSRCRKSLSLMW